MTTPAPRRRNLALIGARGTGKTSVGRIVADRLGLPFVDADAELERTVGRSIAAIFAEGGEAAFRDLEEETLGALTARDGLVLATGGGAVLRAANRRALREFGLVAWLMAEPGVLAERLRRDAGGRPALTEAGLLAEIAAVLEARVPLYQEVADAALDTTGLSPAEVAAVIVSVWSPWHAAGHAAADS
ncbi:MAG TPA: shikimate kinase [Isosphaeraceae bacterium]